MESKLCPVTYPNTLTPTIWQEPASLCNTPCKYFKKGMCKLGYNCRYQHANPKVRRPSEEHEITVNKTICNQICKYGRRPYLHIAVLYASDPRVNVYTQEIVEKFCKNGIDVAVQRCLLNTDFSPQLKRERRFVDIRTEHLAEIICSSHADFLIVLGDRNMKNKSCQAKRKGKLIEMKITDMINLIWKSWPQNPHKTQTRIQYMSPSQSETLIFQYTGQKQVVDRLNFLKNIAQALKQVERNDSEIDEDTNLKITNAQESSIRLHKQLKKAIKTLNKVPVLQEDPNQKRGQIVSLQYNPNSARATRTSISDCLKYHLQKIILIMMAEIEQNSKEINYLPLPLWDEYYQKHQKKFLEFKALHVHMLVDEATIPGYYGLRIDPKAGKLTDNEADEGDLNLDTNISYDEELFSLLNISQESNDFDKLRRRRSTPAAFVDNSNNLFKSQSSNQFPLRLPKYFINPSPSELYDGRIRSNSSPSVPSSFAKLWGGDISNFFDEKELKQKTEECDYFSVETGNSTGPSKQKGWPTIDNVDFRSEQKQPWSLFSAPSPFCQLSSSG